MPPEGLPWIEHEDVLRFEEVERLVALLTRIGVTDFRLTGGEPLVRRDFVQLAGMLAKIDGVRDLALTTNGFLLERDAAALVKAGIKRFNISIDSLSQDRFFHLVGRDALARVLKGLDALHAAAPEAKTKINAVALRGFTESEVLPFARFARETGFEVRFIEYMPLDAKGDWSSDQVLNGEEIRAIIAEHYEMVELPREPHATARVFEFADGRGKMGFISPVSEPFCADCNRIRLTADGRLLTCLFSINETDLQGPLRAGADDGEIERIIREAVWRKELKHAVGEEGFQQPGRPMSQIGG